MARTLQDLLGLIAGDTEEQVQAATNRWKNELREQMRSLTGFKLSYREASRVVQVSVPIYVVPGLPGPLDGLIIEDLDEDDRWAIEVIGVWKHHIETLKNACSKFPLLFEQLESLQGWSSRISGYREILKGATEMSEELLKYAAMASLLDEVREIEEDILGAYFYIEKNQLFDMAVSKTRIELYWLVIGAFARIIGVSIEGLTAVVLAHELAHAYTHVGRDIDGKSWQHSFTAESIEIKEGLAQYYTHLAVEKLREDGYADIEDAYKKLLRNQSGPYLCHLDWTEQLSPEIVRDALMKTRRSNAEVKIEGFRKSLDASAKTLSR